MLDLVYQFYIYLLPHSLKSSYLICCSFLHYLPFAFPPLFISAMSLFHSPLCEPDKLLRMKIHLIQFENKSASCLLLRSAATDQRPAVIHYLTRRLRSAEHRLAPPLISLFIANPVDANREYDPE